METVYLQVITIVLSAAASFVSGLVLWHLRLMNARLEQLEKRGDERMTRIEAEQKALAARPEMCRRDFVDKVDYIREVTSQRQLMEKMLGAMNRLEGRVQVIDKMPEICGSIAREVVKEMKR